MALLLAGCGSSSGTTSHPTANLAYSSPALVFVVGAAITPVVPTASPGLSGYSVAPALPAGLSLDPANGTLSGTPTAASAAATYTVTASGGGASASASISITVNPTVPSSVNYGAAAFTFTTNIAARTLQPTAKGGAATSWSINPALPVGLTFDTTDGAIGGMPTGTSAPTSYVVTAQNASGQATVNLTIEVDAGVLLDLGHDTAIIALRMNGSSVLSLDQSGHWILWDYTSAGQIASGDLYCAPDCPPTNHLVDMAGSTVVLATTNGFEFLSAVTGQVVSSITTPSVRWWSLASDGSYLAAGSGTGLFAWSAQSGASVASVSGNYTFAIAFAAPGTIEVANSPAGGNLIQMISVPGGTVTTGPTFNGAFNSWFLDGSRFIATAGSTVLVYSQASVQQAVITLPSIPATLVGQGNWVWTPAFGNALQIFAIASGSTPAASFPITSYSYEFPSANTIAIIGLTGGVSIVDLSGGTPTKTDYTLPTVTDYGTSSYTYAAASTSQLVIGNVWGALMDGATLGGAPRYFDYGKAWSIAGSSGSIAIATASGRILYFDSGTLTQEGTIPYLASQVLLSSDGTVMAAAGDQNDAQYNADWSIRIYSLPGAGLLYTWPYPFPAGVIPVDVALSGNGAVLGQVLKNLNDGSVALQVNPATGGSAIYGDSASGVVDISPGGTLLATSLGGPTFDSGTDIVKNGSLTTAVLGWPAGWIDDGHLLVNSYARVFSGPAIYTAYAGCSVLDETGQSTGPCALAQEVDAFQTLSADTIYSLTDGSIFSVSTGNVVWTSGDPATKPPVSAVAGSHVVFVSGRSVLAQGY